MFRRIEDFVSEYDAERRGTLELMRMMTDRSLSQAIEPGGRTLGFLAWHLVSTIPEMLGKTGLRPDGPAEHAPPPSSVRQIVREYEHASASVIDDIGRRWTDADLTVSVTMYGNHWSRGLALDMFIRHETHHRGQMTVLMRQAGLAVPGMYGPSREEWRVMGLEPQP